MSNDIVVPFKPKKVESEFGLEEFLEDITKKIKEGTVVKVVALAFSEEGEDSNEYLYTAGDWKEIELIGALEMIKHSIQND